MGSGIDPPASGTPTIRQMLVRLAMLGVLPGDTDAMRMQKVALTLASVTVTLLALVWVGVYLVLDLPVSAAIPFSYQVASVISLLLFARTKNYRFLRLSQMVLMTILPFLLQWSLGGYVASSAVSLWALIAAFGALFFYTAREAIPWFAAFLALTVTSGLADPFLSSHPAAIPAPVVVAFFVLNVVGVSLTAYLLLQYSVRERDAALALSDGLLLNVLPRSIAERLKHTPGIIADRHEDVTVLFADIADFTPFAERTSPERVVGVLDQIFSAFDELTRRRGLEKIKTVGDAYMVVGGLPEPRPDHAPAVVELALEMQAEMTRLREAAGLELELRIGIASGPVVAGVIGQHRFLYDLWGDTVNTSSRMESHGVVGRIQVTEGTVQRLSDRYQFEGRGAIEIKGKGPLTTYLLVGRKVSSSATSGPD
ncbi:MAG: adenylate/guanylate cyclase domain-containing protein [Chloroflexi bacterium]|nr:adenylate/guanylate cyclase domain-containing protein [Chloroflexota bacterium]